MSRRVLFPECVKKVYLHTLHLHGFFLDHLCMAHDFLPQNLYIKKTGVLFNLLKRFCQEKTGSLSKPVGYFLCMTHFQEAEMNSKERRRSFKICKITSRKVYGAERSLPFLKGGGGRDFLESI
jgi:hypothetical protein